MLAIARFHIGYWLLLAIAVTLVAWPQIDLTVAGWFYDPFDGFVHRHDSWVRAVFLAVPWVSRTVIAALLILLVSGMVIRRPRAWAVRYRRHVIYLLLVAALGPLFLVNAVFKDHWGRARPSQIEQFGGDREFSRALVPSDQCEKNCSFVSGHASVGFFFLSLAFVWPRRRTVWIATGTALGLVIGFARILQGGHFLSDVVFSGIVVYLTAVAMNALMNPLRQP